MQLKFIAFVALVVLSLLSPRSFAQCGEWAPGDGLPGVSTAVNDVILWDPDADGPDQPVLVAAGEGIFGDFRWRGVVTWTGDRWEPLGAQVSGPTSYTPTVNALAIFRGELIAAGHFERVGDTMASSIVRWDGQAWQPIGSGIGGFVEAMAVFGNFLYVAGGFNVAGGVAARSIARWNGTNWYPLSNTGPIQSIYALAVHDNTLFIGGSFAGSFGSYLVGWTGTEFTGIGSPNGTVYSLLSDGERLIIGGAFTTAAGTPAARIASWDGEIWSPFGSGLSNEVHSLAMHQGELIAGLRSGLGLMRWDGIAWSAFEGGLGLTDYGRVRAILSSGDDLIIAGFQIGSAGGRTALNIARWRGGDNGAWNRFGDGFNGPVNAMTVHQGALLAAGAFSSAGEADAAQVASWNGKDWSPIGEGGGSGFRVAPIALTVYNDEVVAGGSFDQVDGAPVRAVARFTGGSWQQVGAGIDSIVYSLTVHNAALIAGCGGGILEGSVMSWDGADWRELGPGFDGRVYAVISHNNELFAAGSFFNLSDGAPMQGIARWDAQAGAWRPVGPGLNSSAHALTVHAGRLIVGGVFTTAGLVRAQSVAAWDGVAWSELGAGVGSPFVGRVLALASMGGSLFAGGSFDFASGAPANRIARWDGENWPPLGAGLADSTEYGGTEVRALASYAGALAVGGNFLTADGQVSAHFARWLPSPCAADFNCDAAVNTVDFFEYLTAFFEDSGRADFDHNGAVTSQDFFAFLAAFFAEC